MGLPPDSPKLRRSRYLPMLLTAITGVFLAGGSCFGFLNTIQGSSPINTAFAIGFFAGLAAILASIVWAFVRYIRLNFFSDENKEKS